MQSWLGRQWDPTANAGTGGFVDGNNDFMLDNKAAAANTDRLSHKIRTETSWRAAEYLELFVGGSFTIAGRNAPVETDMHFGFNTTF